MKFNGSFEENGTPIFKATLTIPDLNVEHPLNMVFSTGSPRTIICAKDASGAGIKLEELPEAGKHQMTDQFGNTFAVSDLQAHLTFTNERGEGRKVTVNAAVRHHDDPGNENPRSIMAGDVLQNMTLTMNAKLGHLEIST